MRYGWVFFCLISIGVVLAAYGITKEPHQFSKEECRICHLDIEKDPGGLKPVLSSICEGCHTDIRVNQSHPVDIAPEMSIPADMPLLNGKLSCITCHFVHPFSIPSKKFSNFILRRPGRGPIFCSVCHRLDEKGHILFENVHLGSFQETDRNTSLDTYTLQCLECHDSYLDKPIRSLGAGSWQHTTSSRLNHPVGVSHVPMAAQNPRTYHPPAASPN